MIQLIINNFITIWIAISSVIIIFGLFITGYSDDPYPIEAAASIFSFAIIWPLALLIAVAISPLLGIFYLGKYIGKKRKIS